MERFSPSYSENRLILIVNRCQASLTSAGVLGMPGPAGQCVPVLGAALSLGIQSGPGILQASSAILRPFLITSTSPMIISLPLASFPCSGLWCLIQDMDPFWISRFCLGLGRILSWMIFFCFSTCSSLFLPSLETHASGYIDFRWI